MRELCGYPNVVPGWNYIDLSFYMYIGNTTLNIGHLAFYVLMNGESTLSSFMKNKYKIGMFIDID
jgi:hypothetical protein